MKGFEGLLSVLREMNTKFISPTEIESSKFLIVFKSYYGGY
jgi:hypothetical protein